MKFELKWLIKRTGVGGWVRFGYTLHVYAVGTQSICGLANSSSRSEVAWKSIRIPNPGVMLTKTHTAISSLKPTGTKWTISLPNMSTVQTVTEAVFRTDSNRKTRQLQLRIKRKFLSEQNLSCEVNIQPPIGITKSPNRPKICKVTNEIVCPDHFSCLSGQSDIFDKEFVGEKNGFIRSN